MQGAMLFANGVRILFALGGGGGRCMLNDRLGFDGESLLGLALCNHWRLWPVFRNERGPGCAIAASFPGMAMRGGVARVAGSVPGGSVELKKNRAR